MYRALRNGPLQGFRPRAGSRYALRCTNHAGAENATSCHGPPIGNEVDEIV